MIFIINYFIINYSFIEFLFVQKLNYSLIIILINLFDSIVALQKTIKVARNYQSFFLLNLFFFILLPFKYFYYIS